MMDITTKDMRTEAEIEGEGFMANHDHYPPRAEQAREDVRQFVFSMNICGAHIPDDAPMNDESEVINAEAL